MKKALIDLQRSGAFLCLLTLVLTSGCKTMTSRRAALEKDTTVKKKEAAETVAENQAAITQLDKEAAELELKARQIAERNRRTERWQEAINLLQKQDFRGALAIADEILEAHPEDEPQETPPPEIGPDGLPIIPEKLHVPLDKDERARLLVIRGSALFELGSIAEAIPAYQKALELDSSFRPTRINLGKMLFQQRRYGEAIEVWKLDIAEGYRSGEIMYLMGQAYFEEYHRTKSNAFLESSRVCFSAAMVAMPGDPDVQRWLATVEYRAQRWAEAARLFEQLAIDHPLDSNYVIALAECYAALGQRKEAIAALEKISRVRGLPPRMYETLGRLYSDEGLPGMAADAYLKRYEKEGKKAPSDRRFWIGLLLADAERLEEALQWFETLESSDAEHVDAQAQIATIFLKQNKQQAALTALRQVRAERPDNGAAHLTAGDIHLELEQLEEAKAAFSAASAIPGFEVDGLVGLGDVAYSAESYNEALKHYQDALEKDPNSDRVKYLIARVQEEIEATKGGES